MAIKPSITSSPIASPTQTPKKKGSGFVSFDKAAEQNLQASQQLGQQIGSNIGQQVQAAQGQVGAAAGGVKSQLQLEKERLGQAQNLVQGLKTDPVQVAKSQYADLTSGTAKQADTKDLASLQGTLGSTAQVAQQFSSNPFARQQAIQSTVRRPTAMQNLTGVQRNLDSMLLGRNVNTQDLATQTARQAFNIDRLIGSTLKEAGKTGKELQEQALRARSQLKEARQSGISDTEKAGEGQATEYNTAQQGLVDYLNEGKFFEDLASTGDPKDATKMQQIVDILKQGGLDLTADLDLTDLGKEGFEGLVKTSFQKGMVDKNEALTNEQRARLKALYGLENETRDYLEKEYAPVGSKFTGAEKILEASKESAGTTEQYKTAFENVYNRLLGNVGANWGNTAAAGLYLLGKDPFATLPTVPTSIGIGTRTNPLLNQPGAGPSSSEMEKGYKYITSEAGKQALRDALLRGGRDPQYYDKTVDELFQQLTGDWGQARGQTMEDIQRFARRTPTRFSDIYKRNLKG